MSFVKGFRDFIMRGNVVDLAVAVVVGTAFNQVVNSMVADIITPLIGLLGGVPDFSSLKLGPVTIGKFINAVLSFLVVAAAVYVMVVVPMKKLAERRKKEESTLAEPPEDIKLLREILEELRKKS